MGSVRSGLARARRKVDDGAADLDRLNSRAAGLEQAVRTEPLVSVVLPTFDRPDRLPRAIDSVIAQRYQRWELVVVDDGSETATVVRSARVAEGAEASAG